MSVLLVEKINHRFKRMTGSRKQDSGLGVCLGMIAELEGVQKCSVDNVSHLKCYIERIKPKKVLVSALWMSESDMRELRRSFPSIEFFIHIHSNFPFLATEGYAFNRILEAERQGFPIVFNNEKSVSGVEHAIYLPNYYSKEPIEREIKDSDEVNIICAGSLRPMKNHANQALGAIIFANKMGKKLRFHCNLSRSEGGEATLTSLKGIFSIHKEHELVNIPWQDHDDFIKYCSKMDYGLQVSMSESFNIVAADYVTARLPMVVSSEIEWASDGIKADISNPQIISDRLEVSDLYVESNIQGLKDHNLKAKKLWGDFCGT